MEIKYLYGYTWCTKEGAEDVRENQSLEDCLFLTRKTDTFQHADMRSQASIGVLWGGFVKRFRKPDDAHFYGESVSCQVETPESEEDKKRLLEAYTKGQYWKMEAKMSGGSIYTVFAIVPEGFYPAGSVFDRKWEKTTHADMKDIIHAEAEASCGW